MIRGRGGARVAVAFAVLVLVAPAYGALDVPGLAQGPLRVALLSTTPDDPLAGRIEAELRAIGIDVSRAVVALGTGIDDQVRATIADGARAVIVADGQRTDVWIAQPGSDRVGLRQELEVDEASGLGAVLALRTVEFLRISLGLVAEPEVAPPTTRLPIPVAQPIPVAHPIPSARQPSRQFATNAGAGALTVTGGGGTIAVAGLSLRAQLVGVLGAELSAFVPLTEATLMTAAGEATNSAWMVGGGILLAPRVDQRLSFDLGAGSLLTIVISRGVMVSANTTNNSTSTDHVIRAVLYGRGAARLQLLPRLSLRLDLYGGGVIAPPPITFLNTKVATWGPGFAAGMGGAELTF